MNLVERIKNILDYREMIMGLVRRELRGRYQRSALGLLWTLVNPLCQILIYDLVFTRIFHNPMENYFLHLAAGILPWSFFTESLISGTTAITSGAEMVRKIYFPREVLPVAAVTAKAVNFLLSLPVLILFSLVCGRVAGFKYIFMVIPLLLAQYFLCLAFAMLMSALTVYFRDLEYIINLVLFAWIWATPIMYNYFDQPETMRRILVLNPMTSIVTGYQAIFYHGRMPNLVAVGLILLASIVLLMISELIFGKLDRRFAEEL